MITGLLSRADQAEARSFIETQGLAFEPDFDDFVGVHEGGAVVAVGARHRNVLKMIAIAPSHQGGSLLGELVGELVRLGLAAGEEALFVFTRPESAGSFEALNFELLASHGRAALLEYGGAFARYLEEWRGLVREGRNGAAVVNCNPFTRGHRYLLEEASKRVDTLYVFVVREDRSAFPFEARLALVREGTRDLENVCVLDTSRYAVSALTFPAYFLKQGCEAAQAQMELDLVLFAQRIAPFFRIVRRFFGSEPTCATTRAYNVAMRRLLPRFGVEPVEIERKEALGEPISASRVRAALRGGDLAGLEVLVPEATLAHLRSDSSRETRERLRRDQSSRSEAFR